MAVTPFFLPTAVHSMIFDGPQYTLWPGQTTLPPRYLDLLLLVIP